MKLRRRKCIPSCASHQRVDEDELYCDGKKREEESAWLHNSAHVISQLAQCFTNAMVGPRAWIGGFFSRTSNKRLGSDKYLNYTLTPIQEERLQRLQERLGVPFDETRIDHQEALQALWNAAFPNIKLNGLISEQWKDMGWQGPNPSTDFREYLKVTFQRLLLKQGGERAKWEYPFAVAGINVSFMLIQMLDLHSELVRVVQLKTENVLDLPELPPAKTLRYLKKPKCLPGFNFVRLLGENEEAFDVLYCIAFAMMDAQWLAMHASYMEFNEVLQVTRAQLERELSLEDVHRIEDLPAYNMLFH